MNDAFVMNNHLFFSTRLYEINYKSKRIIDELESKKMIKNKLFGISHELYKYLQRLSKPKSWSSNEFSGLLYFLDEILCFEMIGNYFEYNNKKIPITQCYYNQDDWIDISGYHNFILDKDYFLNHEETLLINSFLDEYEGIINEIEHYLNGIQVYSDRIKAIIKKTKLIIVKMKKKLINLKYKMLMLLNHQISELHHDILS